MLNSHMKKLKNSNKWIKLIKGIQLENEILF